MITRAPGTDNAPDQDFRFQQKASSGSKRE